MEQNRRKFLKSIGLAAAGAIAAPYILPSGRLFARSGARKADHVVFCLFAGGIRNLEAMQKSEGNLLRNLLPGNEAISADLAGSMTNLPNPSGQSLLSQGTLFREFRYASGPTGHYNGHTTAITGNYTNTDLNLKMPPASPTIFEYYRKHNSPLNSALNAWWISNTLGPYPFLNYSTAPGYGSRYGANYIQPATILSQAGYNTLAAPKTFSATDRGKIEEMRSFFRKNFSKEILNGDAGVTNPPTDAADLEGFLLQSLNEAVSGQYVDPWGIGAASMNSDMYNVFFAEKVLQKYKPELLVVNMQDVDIGHSNFTQYCNNLRRADYALWHLWQTIQSTPGMANNTVLIAAPEHGRNLSPNTLVDGNGRYALDHTGDPTSREIFCLVAGPSSVVRQNNLITAVEGESIDIVPTIAYTLGFNTDIPSGLLPGTPLHSAFL